MRFGLVLTGTRLVPLYTRLGGAQELRVQVLKTLETGALLMIGLPKPAMAFLQPAHVFTQMVERECIAPGIRPIADMQVDFDAAAELLRFPLLPLQALVELRPGGAVLFEHAGSLANAGFQFESLRDVLAGGNVVPEKLMELHAYVLNEAIERHHELPMRPAVV